MNRIKNKNKRNSQKSRRAMVYTRVRIVKRVMKRQISLKIPG